MEQGRGAGTGTVLCGSQWAAKEIDGTGRVDVGVQIPPVPGLLRSANSSS